MKKRQAIKIENKFNIGQGTYREATYRTAYFKIHGKYSSPRKHKRI